MKKPILLLLLLFVAITVMLAQAPAPPLPPGEASNGGSNGPVGGNGAPIGTGIILMTSLFAAYGAKKAWDQREKLEE